MEKLRICFIGGKQAGFIGLLTLKSTKCKILSVVAYDDSVKILANKLKIPTFDSIKDSNFIKYLYKSDLLLSVHGREIVPIDILKIPKFGCINVHPCLYKYKGSNPIGRFIKDENNLASVGVHYMDERVDEGKVIYEKFIDIKDKNSIDEVYNQLYIHYSLAILESIDIIKSKANVKT
ncbi:MAG: methionyl-tRNA formyltransferase [Candidatus Methanofastidiosum methylothiophilum]|jgi:methionyl-tRNA formyltransferase|uniref:Methionyl-tRNA formyltransferase n=1 Tax=Candidatus Methanofastidiosum methylothiophilum TaxID=1705564 RepID=A0A150J9Z6_9EURY|nr:MAG: methionyl-tRNA formyltransferase [Candidatus Methanofastidiosum methylthiophilus]KYC55942.1 MAG: methionyl-tRNA formyltransferase [Candidatus Methanofastidiosum methylthiophilus]KYC56689.1 MAG: methionyl-tRNA formyltransferase [Candidatus Methanofastidiosum methylthiophilus]